MPPSAPKPNKCIACHMLGDKRCYGGKCFWAPYFPFGEKEDDFKLMHERFHGENVRDILYRIPGQTEEGKELRRKAMDSFVWEAKEWNENPENPPLTQYLAAVAKERELLNRYNLLVNVDTSAQQAHDE